MIDHNFHLSRPIDIASQWLDGDTIKQFGLLLSDVPSIFAEKDGVHFLMNVIVGNAPTDTREPIPLIVINIAGEVNPLTVLKPLFCYDGYVDIELETLSRIDRGTLVSAPNIAPAGVYWQVIEVYADLVVNACYH